MPEEILKDASTTASATTGDAVKVVTDNDAILEAVKELTKIVAANSKKIDDSIAESQRWYKANRGF